MATNLAVRRRSKRRLLLLPIVTGVVLLFGGSTALASTGDFGPTEEGTAKAKAEGGPITVIEGDDSVSCGHYSLSTELEEGSSSLTLVPSYSECTMTVSGKKETATAKVGSCDLVISSTEETEEKAEDSKFKGTFSVSPSTCGAITFEASECKFEIPAQELPNGVTLKETESSGLEVIAEDHAKVKASCDPCPKMEFDIFGLAGGALIGKAIFDELITTQLTVPTKIKFTAAKPEETLTIENNEIFGIWLVNYKVEGAGRGSFEEPKGCKQRPFWGFNLNPCTITVKSTAAGKAELVFKAAYKKRVVGKTELER
jgi:hypothetical protein